MKLAPSLFIGHGSPMNVIETNSFNDELKSLSKKLDLQNIKAIICISAHYQTEGIEIDESKNPKTIHDFYGFPDELYQMQYNANGSPEIAHKIYEKIKNQFDTQKVKLTTNWGFDHGAWNVLWHLVPDRSIPVVMLSLDYNLSFEGHYQLGNLLGEFRKENIMILGSGNIVHSFKGIQFSNNAPIHPHAERFETYVKNKILEKNHRDLIVFQEDIYEAAKFSVNSAEHYLPLLYVLGSAQKDELPKIFSDEIVFSTLSMLSLSLAI